MKVDEGRRIPCFPIEKEELEILERRERGFEALNDRRKLNSIQMIKATKNEREGMNL